MVVQAYAKINIVLNVQNVFGANHYHKINTIMIPLKLHDSIDIVKIGQGKDTFVTCDSFELMKNKYNVVTKAISLTKEYFNIKENFKVTIIKRVFISSGLGGGSADAAAVMLAIIKKFKINPTKEQLLELGMKVGSDVAFFLFGKPAIVSGTGNEVEVIDNITKKYYVLLVKPKEGVATSSSYTKFDEIGKATTSNLQEAIEAYNAGEEELSKVLVNDLEMTSTILVPEIAEVKKKIIDAGFNCTMMSGSGSCVFALSSNKRKLFKLFRQMFEEGYQVEFTKTTI